MWRNTYDLVNHMKDIHDVQDTQPHLLDHVRYRDMAAKPGSVQWTGSREGPQHTHNSTILRMPILQEILTDHQKSTGSLQNNEAQKVQSDINDHNHNDITHFLREWSNTSSTESMTFYRLCL